MQDLHSGLKVSVLIKGFYMEFVSIFVAFVVGLGLGYVACLKLSSSKQEADSIKQEFEEKKASLESYKLEVSRHLESSVDLLNKMTQSCESAMRQMEESTSLLKEVTPEANTIPLFSEETQSQLYATEAERKRQGTIDVVKDSAEPPRDYSAEQSGIFIDKKQTVTNS